MYGYRITAQVARKQKAMSGVLRKVMVIFAILCVLMGILFSRGFMLPGFLFALLYFVYDIFSQKDYEYTLEGTKFSVGVIRGKRYRKEAHELDLSSLEVVAPNWHERVAKYRINGGTEKLPKFDYTSYEDDVPYYTMIVMEKQKKIKLLLDLNEEMLKAMKQMYPERVFLQ